MLTKEEIRAKADATRLKNLLAKAATRPLSGLEATVIKTLQAQAMKPENKTPQPSE